MAFTAAEVEEFIGAIQQDPALRDRVRNAILADDFLALRQFARKREATPSSADIDGAMSPTLIATKQHRPT